MEIDKEISEVIVLLKTIHASKKRGIDGKILSCALYMVWGCGVKEKEIPGLKIKDIVDQAGNVADTIKFGRDSGPLADEASETLTGYLKYLKENGMYSKPDDKLFPGYNIIRTLERHVGEFYSGGQLFHTLRKVGIKNCCYSLLNSGKREAECLRLTAVQFRITEAGVKRVVRTAIQPAVKNIPGGTIQPAGNCKGADNNNIIRLFDKLIMTNPSDTAAISKVKKELFTVVGRSRFYSEVEKETIKNLFEDKIKG